MAKTPKSKAPRASSNHKRPTRSGERQLSSERRYTILDYRLEKPRFELRQVRDGDSLRYQVSGDLTAPVPPIRDSKYLS